jgi:hypothetical protein
MVRATSNGIRLIEPMYALRVQNIPEGKEWLYEVKFDGYRCLAGRDKSGVRLWSRRGNLFTTQFPRIPRAKLKGLEIDTAPLRIYQNGNVRMGTDTRRDEKLGSGLLSRRSRYGGRPARLSPELLTLRHWTMPRTATDVPNALKINHKSHSAFGSIIIRASDTTIIMMPHTAPSAYHANRILFICMRKTTINRSSIVPCLPARFFN